MFPGSNGQNSDPSIALFTRHYSSPCSVTITPHISAGVSLTFFSKRIYRMEWFQHRILLGLQQLFGLDIDVSTSK